MNIDLTYKDLQLIMRGLNLVRERYQIENAPLSMSTEERHRWLEDIESLNARLIRSQPVSENIPKF